MATSKRAPSLLITSGRTYLDLKYVSSNADGDKVELPHGLMPEMVVWAKTEHVEGGTCQHEEESSLVALVDQLGLLSCILASLSGSWAESGL